ncbi:hypothetical protein BHE90_006236 [Fusarium euwallaceae]|uniref:Uncharacterized protein n=2 Tax=Fusarium solani species complex TaxID=232080 RepID=A0A430LUB4_9HYPO|nr:hypothetical protein CDV31_007337 [Fusarium ambrosium]RTE79308.1 hypothetical protein BHE90_006236 [Fusarium euwallaceae]
MASFGLLVLGRQKSPDDRLGQVLIRQRRLLAGGNGVCGSVLGYLGVRVVGDYLLGSTTDAEREQSFVEGADAIVRSVRAKWKTVGLTGDGHLRLWSALSPSLCIIIHSRHFALEVPSDNIAIADIYEAFYEPSYCRELNLLVEHPCGAIQDDLVRLLYGAHSTLPNIGGWRRPGNAVTSTLR